jgi:Obg family GTPase CgtA
VAESGSHGSSAKKHGRNGKNTVLRVPCGVVVRRVLDYDDLWDEETKTVTKRYKPKDEFGENDERTYESDESESDDDEEESDYEDDEDGTFNQQPYLASTDETVDDFYDDYIEEPDANFIPWGERETVDLADLDKAGSYVVVAKGGQGGTGSSVFASRNGPSPGMETLAAAAMPEEGETAFLVFELKLIADIGLVGFPNAGKSSLLAAMSRATPHIAPYPFTTLNPLVGYIEYKDGFRVCAADVPGLIAGASQGRGKGHDFLRHLERTKALLYIVDAAGVDGRDPINDFEILVDELSAYGHGDMLNRRCLVVANKMDLLDETHRQDLISGLNKVVEEAGIRMQGDIIGISAGVTGEGLASLSKAIRSTVKMSEADKAQSDRNNNS